MTPKYNNGALVFDEIDYNIQVADWQTGETIVFKGDDNLTAQSTPSFTVTNALSISGTEADGKTNPTEIWSGIEDNTIYLRVISQTTGTMLECPEFPSDHYGQIASETTNDENGNLVEVYQIVLDNTVDNLTDYTFTLSNSINTAHAKQFVVRKDASAHIGDFFYTDGTWSTNYIEGKTIAGLVFSTELSDYDKNTKNYTHGYVVALENASDGAMWRTSNTDVRFYSVDNTSQETTYASMIADLDGYSHTMYIKDHFPSTYTTEFPAFYEALIY